MVASPLPGEVSIHALVPSQCFKRTLVCSKGAFLGDVGTQILMQHGGLQSELLELGDITGRNGHIQVLAVVKVEGDGSDVGDLRLDGSRIIVGGDAEGLESIVGDLLLERGDSRGGGQRQHEREASEELHRERYTLRDVRGWTLEGWRAGGQKFILPGDHRPLLWKSEGACILVRPVVRLPKVVRLPMVSLIDLCRKR